MLVKVSVLAITFALGVVPVWAQQQVGVDGACAGLDLITGTARDTLAAVNITIPNTGSVWHCVCNCYIQVDHITGLDVDGQLVLTNNGAVVPLTERNFELNDNAGINDPEFKEVSTGAFIPNLPAGNRTLACAARKLVAADPNYNVARSCVKCVCSDFQL
jgi:hypothetical protein